MSNKTALILSVVVIVLIIADVILITIGVDIMSHSIGGLRYTGSFLVGIGAAVIWVIYQITVYLGK